MNQPSSASRARSVSLLIASSSSILALMLACGGSGDSTFGSGSDLNASSSSGSTSGDFGSTSSSGGTSGSSGELGDGAACAAQEALATRVPAYLFFLFDKSGSMGDGDHGDPDEKWYPVTEAFKGFIASSDSAGVSASLTMFPDTSTGSCNVSSYQTPDVALTALPHKSSKFTSALGTVGGLGTVSDGTPTLPALKGVLPLAEAHAKAHRDAKTVLVLVTDGEPRECDGNSIENIGKEVAKYNKLVKTYVIGVGEALTSLNSIAKSGGTKEALIVNVGTPSVTRDQFAAKIDDIRSTALSCDLGIPAPPQGQTLDFDKINVSYTPSKGAKQALAYDASCAGAGWKFDDEASPEKIVLCKSTCDVVKKDPQGKVGVEFGCERRSGGVN